METDYNKGNFKSIAAHYSIKGKVIGQGTEVSGPVALKNIGKGSAIWQATGSLPATLPKR